MEERGGDILRTFALVKIKEGSDDSSETAISAVETKESKVNFDRVVKGIATEVRSDKGRGFTVIASA